MKFLPVILLVIYIQIRATTQKDTKKSDDKKFISIGLVSKDWKPRLLARPKDPNTVLESYKGTVTEANYLLKKYEDPFDESHRDRLENAVSLFDQQYGYDPAKESIFSIQYSHETNNGAALQNVVMAMAMRNMLKFYNVFSIDLQHYQGKLKSVIKATGDQIIEFFFAAKDGNKITDVNKIHLLGHGLLGQLAGYIARSLKKKYNQQVKSILALDPQSVDEKPLGGTLSADDAEVVHAYHFSMMMGTMSRKSVDIIFNSGWMQPGCKLYSPDCSHQRAYAVLPYLIAYPNRFVARECRHWIAFKLCFCNKNKNTIQLSFPPATKGVGKYHISTFDGHPYGKEEKGSVCPLTVDL